MAPRPTRADKPTACLADDVVVPGISRQCAECERGLCTQFAESGLGSTPSAAVNRCDRYANDIRKRRQQKPMPRVPGG